MVEVRMRHLVRKPSGWYFQATPKMRAAGIRSEPLGRNTAEAVARTEQLNAAWDEIRRHVKEFGYAPGAKAPALPGTVEHLVDTLRGSAEWSDKSARTIEEIEGEFKFILDVFGPSHVHAVTPQDSIDLYAVLRQKHGINKSFKTFKWLRYLFNFAIRVQYAGMTDNPARAVRLKRPPPRQQVWTPEWVEASVGLAWLWGWWGEALAIAICYDTSLRPGDVRTLRIDQYDGESFSLVQAKTGQAQRVPVWPETARLIERYLAALTVRPVASAVLIRTERGRTFSRNHLAKRIRAVMRGAGIPDTVQLRDLRRTASVERAEAGATAAELAAGTGHSIARGAQILDVYNPGSYHQASAAQAKRRAAKRNKKG